MSAEPDAKKPKLEIETELNVQNCLELAKKVALECGVLIKNAFLTTNRNVQYKGTIDLVTDVDQEVEKRIFSAIKSAYPNHKTIGEESVAAGGTEVLTDAPTWIVDPIDGTTNFVHGMPWCAISIGFAVQQKLVMGVVYNAALDELYHATLGCGAFVNGKKISVSQTTLLQHSLVATGFAYDRRDEWIDFNMACVRKVLMRTRDIRRFGSAALDMCAVACGRIDAYFESGIHIWDIAAATVILREAGGVACDPFANDQNQLDLGARKVLAAAPGIVGELLALLAHPNPPAPK